MAHLKNKIDEANTFSSDPIGKKNLIYFTVSKEESYIELLDLCLKSIVKYTPNINFDILFITQQSFVDKIKTLPCLSKFNFDFHITDEPKDGVAASVQKLNIFYYKNINQYKKIMFLDCDILCLNPMNHLFNVEFDPKYLQVACNKNVTYDVWLQKSLFFNIDYMTKEQSDFIEAKKPVPFNAGQFYFCNTAAMSAHFKNVLWLIEVWPDYYFFEQSFMNHYFTLNELTKTNILNNICDFILIGGQVTLKKELNKVTEKIHPIGFKKFENGKLKYKVPNQNNIKKNDEPIVFDYSGYYILHFIGMTLFGSSKKVFIQKFLEKNNICL
jgi:lipopolysaccharide biosynthesis glycosyltransferase